MSKTKWYNPATWFQRDYHNMSENVNQNGNQVNEAIKSFKSKVTSEKTRGEGYEDIYAIQGYGNVGVSSLNLFHKNYIDTERSNEIERIQDYRKMASMPEIADVIEDAAIESTQEDTEGRVMELEIADEDLSKKEQITKTLREEFDELFYNRIDINNKMFTFMREYLIDGRAYFENVINKGKASNGIIDIKKLPSETMDYLFDKEGNVAAYLQYLSNDVVPPKSMEDAEEDENIVVFYPSQITMIDTGEYGKSKKQVIGYLEKARQPYNQLKLLETAIVIYRIVRAPERLVFRIDTGNMPRNKSMEYVEKIKRKMNQKQVYDPNSGTINNTSSVMCIRKDTEIPLLDGRCLPLEEIVQEYNNGHTNWVYSINQETGDIEPGKITNAAITRKNEKLVRVWLDDENYIDCTLDHKFILRDGSEKRADQLKENDSLMPLYNRNSSNQRKVFKIEYPNERDDTGCITVEGNHNFGVSRNGNPLIFIKNSILDNYYLPQCIRTNTEIETLDGKTKTLEQIINEYNNGMENEVYSVDQRDRKSVV